MEKPITIVGCGPGAPDMITLAAKNAIEGARYLIGSKRLLEVFGTGSAEHVNVGADTNLAVLEIEKRFDSGSVAVLVSGDPGMFSLAQKVIEKFGHDNCEIVPGVSSIQAAFAAIATSWAGARIISAHKQDPEGDLEEYAKEDKVAILGGRDESIKWVRKLLGCMNGNRRIYVLENLTLPEESVTEITEDGLNEYKSASLSIFIVIKEIHK
ncbi:MAG TPA: precorrin-6y C5,15-methyltransferase (decarboxylating) subunit CbiE [Nitrospinota bacterium]|nr:precorrin-6y C5,15-methyltransferase (decarboxylating) subunit CbiE [Nitrospinota bacterium]|tara:strand:- start:214030 stop:214662 length:633 start_codon:yes stop_codon:yes gene_type:complete